MLSNISSQLNMSKFLQAYKQQTNDIEEKLPKTPARTRVAIKRLFPILSETSTRLQIDKITINFDDLISTDIFRDEISHPT